MTDGEFLHACRIIDGDFACRVAFDPGPTMLTAEELLVMLVGVWAVHIACRVVARIAGSDKTF